MAKYSPPEGYTYDSASGKYYSTAMGSDPVTGASVQWVTWFDATTGEYTQDNYMPAPMHSPYYSSHDTAHHHIAPVSGFSEHLYRYGKSIPFLIGIILFSLANIVNTFIFGFNFSSFISLLLLSLPIIGMWLVFAASVSSRQPKTALAGFMLLKIITVFEMVVFCVAFALILIVSIISGFIAAGIFGAALYDPFLLMIVGFSLIAIFVIVVTLYYVPLLRTINSIRKGIKNGIYTRLRATNRFSVMAFIFIAVGMIGSAFALWAAAYIQDILSELIYFVLWDFPEILYLLPTYDSFVFDMRLSSILSIASYLGWILCLITLIRFNRNARGFDSRHVG